MLPEGSHCCVHNSPPLIPSPNQTNPIHALISDIFKINFIILPQTPKFPNWSLSPHVIRVKFHMHSSYLPCQAICPDLLNVRFDHRNNMLRSTNNELYFIMVETNYEVLHYPVLSDSLLFSSLVPNILLSNLFARKLQYYV